MQSTPSPYTFVVPQTQLVEEAPYQEQRPQEADSSHVEANSSFGQPTQPRRLCKFGPSCTRAQCYFYHPEREVYGYGAPQAYPTQVYQQQGYQQPMSYSAQPVAYSQPGPYGQPQMKMQPQMMGGQMYQSNSQMMGGQQHQMMQQGGHGGQGFPPNRKTKLCHHFEKTGSCPYANGCFFAHGPNELVELPKKGINRSVNFVQNNKGGVPDKKQ